MTLFPETRTTLVAALKCPENAAAWDDFVTVYRPTFYRMARRRGMQDADAQDLVQQVLLRIAGAIERYEVRPEVRFRHWLRRVANNAIATALSKSPRDVAAGGTDALDIIENDVEISSELSREINAEYERELYLRATVAVRVDVNPETWRAFELTMIEGLSCEQAAEAIEKSVGTVYAARSRVVRRLRDQIQMLRNEEE